MSQRVLNTWAILVVVGALWLGGLTVVAFTSPPSEPTPTCEVPQACGYYQGAYDWCVAGLWMGDVNQGRQPNLDEYQTRCRQAVDLMYEAKPHEKLSEGFRCPLAGTEGG